MPECRAWTNEADNVIRHMRAEGATWAAIGAALNLSRNTVIERGRRIRAVGGLVQIARAPRPPEDDPNRGPLPAGRRISWRLLITGKILE